MKLIRFGLKGHEKPGVIDVKGVIRDVSSLIADWTGDTIGNAERLIKPQDLSSFPEIAPSVRLGPPIGNVGKIIGCALTLSLIHI